MTQIPGQPCECQVESADTEGSDPAASPPSERAGLEAWLAGAGVAGRKLETALALCYTEEVESAAELRLLHQVRAQRREAIAKLTVGFKPVVCGFNPWPCAVSLDRRCQTCVESRFQTPTVDV